MGTKFSHSRVSFEIKLSESLSGSASLFPRIGIEKRLFN